MRLVRATALIASSGWLVMTTGYGAAAASAEVELGGAALPKAGTYTDPGNPVPLTAGLWSDVLVAGQKPHEFSYERRMRDSTVHIGVIGAPSGSESDGLRVTVETEAEDSCGSGSTSRSSWTEQSVIGTAVTVGPSEVDDRESACLRATTLAISIDRGYASPSGDLPIALKIVEEAPISTATELPEAAGDIDYDLVSVDPTEERPGARSFADAPRIAPDADGTGFSTTITQGESQLWRVPVGWGEQLAVVGDLPANQAEASSTPYVELRVVGPLRGASTAGAPDTSANASYGSEAEQISVGTGPVRYLNRYESTDAPSVPGEVWIELTAQPLGEGNDSEPVAIPVDLTVVVSGKGAGRPSYVANAPSPDGGAAPTGYDPATPFLIGDGVFSATAGDHAQAAPGSDSASSWWNGRRYGGIGLVAAGAACCAAGVWRLRTR